jgi:hypothetical protein
VHAPSSEYHHGDASSAVSLTDSSILLLHQARAGGDAERWLVQLRADVDDSAVASWCRAVDDAWTPRAGGTQNHPPSRAYGRVVARCSDTQGDACARVLLPLPPSPDGAHDSTTKKGSLPQDPQAGVI